MGTRGPFPRGRLVSVKLTTDLHLVPKLRMCGLPYTSTLPTSWCA